MTGPLVIGSILTSVLLHGGAVALILILTYALQRDAAGGAEDLRTGGGGEGDNYAATEGAGPRVGRRGQAWRCRPCPCPRRNRRRRRPSRWCSAPRASKPVPAKAPPKPVDKTSIVSAMKRAEMRAAVRQQAKDKKAADAEKRKQMTEEEFRKEHGAPKPNAVGIAGGVVGGSIANKTGGAGGKALTREEGTLLDAYFALLISHLKENFESTKPTDVSDKLTAKVAFYVATDGSIAKVRIVESSGNDEFDQAVLEAVRHTHSIGPRPDHSGDEVSVPFSMHDDTAP